METVNEINLSISEPQDVDELNTEELEAISGGFWKDFGNWVGEVVEIPREIFEDFSRGFNRGISRD